MTDDKYTPNMEKLKAELGRVPPSMVDQSRPLEDYAPKNATKPKPAYVSPNWETELSQRIKALMRESDDWERLTWSAREALDMLASKIAGMCVGQDHWDEILDCISIAKTEQEP